MVSPCFPSEPSLIVPGEEIAEPIDNFLNEQAGAGLLHRCYDLSWNGRDGSERSTLCGKPCI